MNSPVLSIIMPVYNVENYLQMAVMSVLEQEFKDFELILVDDGSFDRSGEICRELASQDARIVLITQQNKGLSGARNTGIKAARGEYITFIDSDDTIAKNTLSDNINILSQEKDVDILEYPIYVYYKSPKENLLSFHYAVMQDKDNLLDKWYLSGGPDHCYACNKIFRRELFGDTLFQEKMIFEDMLIMPKLFSKAKKYVSSDKGLYYYFLRENSISNRNTPESLKKFFDAYHKIYDYGVKRFPNEEKTMIYTLNLIDIIISALRSDMKLTAGVFTGKSEIAKVNMFRLMKLNIPFSRKIKNLSYSLMGLEPHCILYKYLNPEEKKGMKVKQVKNKGK